MPSTMGHFIRWAVGLARPETQTTEAERECLVRHAAGRKRLAEIGVWHGVTTRLLRQAMAQDGIICAVDPYTVGRLGFSTPQVIAHHNVNRCRIGHVHWLRATGVEAAKDPLVTLAPIDFLFIDGDHSYEGLKGIGKAGAG